MKDLDKKSSRVVPDPCTLRCRQRCVASPRWRAGASRGSLAGLPRDLAKSLCLQLNARRPLARQLDVLVQRVTYMLDDSSVMVRTSATRAIGGMVSADRRLLESPDIVRALKTRMKDTGSSVRSAVVDVIGRQMVRNVALADKYYDVIEDRVSPTPASRSESASCQSCKSVCDIPNSPRRIKPCKSWRSAY